jgi:hypothetical protein
VSDLHVSTAKAPTERTSGSAGQGQELFPQLGVGHADVWSELIMSTKFEQRTRLRIPGCSADQQGSRRGGHVSAPMNGWVAAAHARASGGNGGFPPLHHTTKGSGSSGWLGFVQRTQWGCECPHFSIKIWLAPDHGGRISHSPSDGRGGRVMRFSHLVFPSRRCNLEWPWALGALFLGRYEIPSAYAGTALHCTARAREDRS